MKFEFAAANSATASVRFFEPQHRSQPPAAPDRRTRRHYRGPAPVVTRVLFSEADLRARDFVKNLCREPGSPCAKTPSATFSPVGREKCATRPIATGSHIDAIPNAGRYDGVVGVLGALEAFRALKQSRLRAGASHRADRCSPLKSRRVSALAVSAAACLRALSRWREPRHCGIARDITSMIGAAKAGY